MKRCYKCKKTKPTSEFHKRKRNKDGLCEECKECKIAYVKKRYSDKKEEILHYQKEYYEKNKEKVLKRISGYRENNIEEVRRKNREYSKSEAGRKKHKKFYAKWREKNKHKEKAQQLFNRNIRPKIDLSKISCSVCGTKHNLSAHHEDYSKPFKVLWLCKAHHSIHHFGKKKADLRKQKDYSSLYVKPTKLTEEIVKKIRKEYVKRKVTFKQLAKKYNVSETCIRLAYHGRNWGSVK